MKKTNKIKIGFREYELIFSDDLYLINEACGTIDEWPAEIKIFSLFDKQEQAAVLLHELLHGVEYFTGHDLGEEKIDGIANTLFLIFKENPHVLKFINEAVNEPI